MKATLALEYIGEADDARLTRYRWPDGGAQVMTPDQLRQLLRETYESGYTAGRESKP